MLRVDTQNEGFLLPAVFHYALGGLLLTTEDTEIHGQAHLFFFIVIYSGICTLVIV